MTQYKRIGIDTSKAVFTLHGIDQQDRPSVADQSPARADDTLLHEAAAHRHRPGSLWRLSSLGAAN